MSPQKLQPKPGFPLRSDQKQESALVLDEAKGIKIPASINTYLRDYQRDGVKFLWRQYNEERGGLLGDDMGLVSVILMCRAPLYLSLRNRVCFIRAVVLAELIRSSGENDPGHLLPLSDHEKRRLVVR